MAHLHRAQLQLITSRDSNSKYILKNILWIVG